MRKLMNLLVVGTMLAMGCAAAGAADSPDPVIGTWTLNAAKSTFKPGPAPKSQTRTYAQTADGVALTVTGVAADGTPVSQQSTFKYDGKDYPMSGSADYDALALKRVNASTVDSTMKRGGKAVGKTIRSISGHGKVLALKTRVKTSKGERAEIIAVYDKQ